MTRSTSWWVCCLLGALLASAAGAQRKVKWSDRFVAKTAPAEKLAHLVEACAGVGLSGSVLLAKDGKVLVALGVGGADADGKRRNSARTLFELASATKQFTAAAILVLVQQGKLQLDMSIAKVLPNIPKECAGITVRHLLQHTSGIPGTNSTGGGDDLGKVIPFFLRGGPKHEPGAHWEYWNQGYALLAGIIQKCSGMSFGKFCHRHLFAKAKMKTARFTGDKAPKGVPVALGFSERGNRTALQHPYGTSYGFQYLGMGGAVASVWDLWRWDRALSGTKVLSQASLRQLFKPGLKDYALGWRVQTKRGRLVQSHGGDVRGFHCEIRRYPQQKACLFLLCNRDGVNKFRLAELLERALFGEKFAPPPGCLDKQLQDLLVGSWQDKRGARLVVKAAARVTTARLEWGGRNAPTTRGFLGQTKVGAFVFYDWHEPVDVKIKRDKNGKVEALRLVDRRFVRSK